jgi:tetratricopeptide (TPR) repeat protein
LIQEGAMRIERQWRRINEYESVGNHEAARIACVSLIQSAPDDIDAWEYLARLETRLGRYRAAHFATTQAAAAVVRGGAVGRLGEVTMRLLGYDEWLAVRELIAAVDRDAPDFLKQAPVLAQHLMLSGDDAGALALCDESRARIRPDPRLEYGAALASRNLGRAADAEQGFERAISIDPDFSPAHWSLAYHRPAGLARLARLEASVTRLRSDASSMADLCYALYRENEAAGRAQIAWTWLARGAAAARSRDHVAGRRPDDPALAFAHPDRVEPPVRPLAGSIFIVGMPRSGTTVLERILGNHSRVHAAGELNSLHAALCHQVDAFLPSPVSTREAPHLQSLERVGDMYLRATRRHAVDDRIVVDKNPANFLYAGLIARALPDARILCLRRSPMDACFSNLRELFEGDAYPYSYALDSLAEHYDWFDRMRTAYEVALPGRFMTVPYEALVADPRSMAERVLSFCGLDYEEGCERIERNAAPVSTASSSQVREPVHARGVGAWETYARFLEPMRVRLNELGVVA